MKQVYTIIVTYNASQYIERCLIALNQSLYETKVIVVDNASTDDTVSRIKANFHQVLLIESPSNLGFGVANNVGIKKALELNCDYVFLLNQDAFVKQDTIQKLIDSANNYKNFDLISPVHLNADGTALDYNWEEYYVEQSNCPGFISDAYLSTPKPIYETVFVNAAAWLLTKQCIKSVGGFTPYFFMYGEDTDFVYRMQVRNMKCAICYHAVITHERTKPVAVVPESLGMKDRTKYVYRYHFLRCETELLNIGNPFWKKFLRIHFDNSQIIARKLFSLRFIDFAIHWYLEMKLLSKTFVCLKYRKESQKESFAHLDFNPGSQL